MVKEKGYSRDTVNLLQMQLDIMEAHLAEEERSAACSPPFVLCDRSAIDPLVYTLLTASDGEDWNRRKWSFTSSERFQRAIREYKNSVVLLLEPVQEWLVDDGVRLTENQERCLELFQLLLKELEIPYVRIGTEMTNLEERIDFVLRLIGSRRGVLDCIN